MKTAICICCGKPFEYVPVRVGDLLYVDMSGREVRCQKEVQAQFCLRCNRAGKSKTGRG